MAPLETALSLLGTGGIRCGLVIAGDAEKGNEGVGMGGRYRLGKVEGEMGEPGQR